MDGDLSKAKSAGSFEAGIVEDETSGLLRKAKTEANKTCRGVQQFSEINCTSRGVLAVQHACCSTGFNQPDTNNGQLVSQIRKRIDKDEAKSPSNLSDTDETKIDHEAVPHSVWYVYELAFLAMLMQAALSPCLLLLTNHRGWTNGQDVSFFATLSLVSVMVPIGGNIWSGQLASATSPRAALLIMIGIVAGGLVIMLLADSSLVFLVGYTLYSMNYSIRIVRLTLLSAIVPKRTLTRVMATHALATPLGALFGPILWLLCAQFRYEKQILVLFPGVLRIDIDRFTLIMGCSALASLAMMSLVYAKIPAEAGRSQASNGRRKNPKTDNRVRFKVDESENSVDVDNFRLSVFRFFCIVMFFINFSAGFFQVGFQPILVDIFHFTDSQIGIVFEIIGILAVIPPILVAILSEFLQDRHIMLFGIVLKLIGMALYSFPAAGGNPPSWRVILGFILIVKASICFFTSAVSLFSKIIGPVGGGALIGTLSSLSAAGPALAQLLAMRVLLAWFGKPQFMLFMLGTVVGLGFVLYPWFWTRLDDERPWLQNLHQAVSADIESQQKA
mmetsp:Transcript_3766/g.11227  ORF Transcript_3766/g.11227 Transcript_3766/m.11227 type:complete len:559 (-) Transcript_3766:1753-3429(-)